MAARVVEAPHPISIGSTLGALHRGEGDPTMRGARGEVVRASRTPDGPVAARFTGTDGRIEVEAFGPGAGWLLRRGDAWCGALDDDSGFHPPPGLLPGPLRRRPRLGPGPGRRRAPPPPRVPPGRGGPRGGPGPPRRRGGGGLARGGRGPA